DPVVNVDAIVIRGDREPVDRLHCNTGAQVDRVFRLQVACTKESCCRRGDWKRADVERHSGDEVRRRRREELLTERWRAETRARPAGKRNPPQQLNACRDLAVGCRTEVAVILEPPSNAEKEARREVAFEIEIYRAVRPVVCTGVRRTEAWKNLCTECGEPIRR